MTRDEAFDKFLELLKTLDLSPKDFAAIGNAAINYASAAAQDTREFYTRELRQNTRVDDRHNLDGTYDA